MDNNIQAQRLQMPHDSAYRKIDMNANNKIDQIFTFDFEKSEIFRYADIDEDGLVDVMTDFKNDTNTIWDKDGNKQVFSTQEFKNDGAFGLGDIIMSQKVEMPKENIFVGIDDNKNGKNEQTFTIADDTGWIVEYQDANEDGIADKLYNYGNRVALEWFEDGSCKATNLDNHKTQTDTNQDNIADK